MKQALQTFQFGYLRENDTDIAFNLTTNEFISYITIILISNLILFFYDDVIYEYDLSCPYGVENL